MNSPSFSLVDEPWIEVTDGGRPARVSLLDALTRAHEIAGLATANPLEMVAVLRQVLLPVYLDACGRPADRRQWLARWTTGELPAPEIKRYLDEHRHRFDLFGAQPFAQVAGLRTAKDETRPVSLLVAAAATGNNVPLFSTRTEADPVALSAAQAARSLLATQCWDTAAIKSGAVGDPQVAGGKTTGNPTGPLGSLGVTVPIGRNLAETLLLNTPFGGQPASDDVPQWRRAPATAGWESRPAKGLLDLLTWQSRRVRLVPEFDGNQLVVRRVVLAAGDRLQPVPLDIEPHTAWRRVDKPKAKQQPQTPVRHVAGRQAWRGLEPMLATVAKADPKFTSSRLINQLHSLRPPAGSPQPDGLPSDTPVQVMTVGVVYGNQSAVVEDVLSDLVPLPLAALEPSEDVHVFLENVLVQAEGLRQAGNRLADEIRLASGGESLPWDKGLRVGDALMHELTPVVQRLLAGLQRQPERWEQAEQAWQTLAERIALRTAEPVLCAVPPSAFLGRESMDGNRKSKDGKWTHRAATAEAVYRSAVRKVLGI
ncbi:type I-E CRISPR-associated protein Cse1/CasA [Micromonospora echinofusca]|uniref:type I-E CRISPR-associated protein Cse1/CasA n=1 Tax=Micromonospora echinofusca TaxID=47858 RepID=UPI0034253E72